MRNVKKLGFVALLLVLVGAPARAGIADEYNLDILLDTVRANKRALVAVNLPLTDDEAAKFWPLYDKYHRELSAVTDRMAAVVQDYTARFKTLSDEDAKKIATDFLTAEADRAKLRQEYLAPFSGVLPGRKVVRFYQIENKIDAVLRYDLAKEIPVIDETPPAPSTAP